MFSRNPTCTKRMSPGSVVSIVIVRQWQNLMDRVAPPMLAPPPYWTKRIEPTETINHSKSYELIDRPYKRLKLYTRKAFKAQRATITTKTTTNSLITTEKVRVDKSVAPIHFSPVMKLLGVVFFDCK